MPEEKTPSVEPQNDQKESKVSMMMIIMLVILIWAVVAYFMTMDHDKADQHPAAATEQSAQEVDSPANAEVAVEATEKAAAAAVVEAENVPAKDEKQAVDALMDVFAPSGK